MNYFEEMLLSPLPDPSAQGRAMLWILEIEGWRMESGFLQSFIRFFVHQQIVTYIVKHVLQVVRQNVKCVERPASLGIIDNLTQALAHLWSITLLDKLCQ